MCKTKLKCNVNYILLRQFLMERSNITSATDGGGGGGEGVGLYDVNKNN